MSRSDPVVEVDGTIASCSDINNTLHTMALLMQEMAKAEVDANDRVKLLLLAKEVNKLGDSLFQWRMNRAERVKEEIETLTLPYTLDRK